MTYAAPLKVFVRLKNRETGEIKESDVFMGDFPLMTEDVYKRQALWRGARGRCWRRRWDARRWRRGARRLRRARGTL